MKPSKSKSKMKNELTVDVFKGKEASVNSYVFSNGKSLMVMDVLRSTVDAKELAKFLKAKTLPLTHILITHGHPDHYIGMAYLKKEFPVVEIIVSNPETKQDIIGFSRWMESVGWLDGEPDLKPKSDKNPEGFDYENHIRVWDKELFTLEGGGTLVLKNDYHPAEAEHLTTVYSKDLNAFFSSDFCYNGVHLWLGQGVDKTHIKNWKAQLNTFKQQYTDKSLTIYPGHGSSADIALFDTVLQYIEDFEGTLEIATVKEEVENRMKQLYPNWEQADFLLTHSADYHMSLKAIE